MAMNPETYEEFHRELKMQKEEEKLKSEQEGPKVKDGKEWDDVIKAWFPKLSAELNYAGGKEGNVQSGELSQSTARDVASTSGTQSSGPTQELSWQNVLAHSSRRSGVYAESSNNTTASPSKPGSVNMIDSMPLSSGFKDMWKFLTDLVPDIVVRVYSDSQKSVECGYVAIFGAFQMKRNRNWTPGKILNGDDKFIRLCNKIINQKPLEQPIWLYVQHIDAILANLEFLEENFEVSVVESPSPSLGLYKAIMGLKEALESGRNPKYVSYRVRNHIRYLRRRTKRGTDFWMKMEDVDTLVSTPGYDIRDVQDAFYVAIADILQPQCPKWARVHGPSQFKNFVQRSVQPGRLEEIEQVVIMNSKDCPGEHWYVMHYVLPVRMRQDLVKAT